MRSVHRLQVRTIRLDFPSNDYYAKAFGKSRKNTPTTVSKPAIFACRVVDANLAGTIRSRASGSSWRA